MLLIVAVAVSVSLAVALTVVFVIRVRACDPVELRSHWGGLGGTTAGWRASPSLIALIGAVVAWLMSAALGLYGASMENDQLREQLRRQEKETEAKLEDQRTKLTREFEVSKLNAERDLARWKAEREFALRELQLKPVGQNADAAGNAPAKPAAAGVQ